jgi:hypothetical protein
MPYIWQYQAFTKFIIHYESNINWQYIKNISSFQLNKTHNKHKQSFYLAKLLPTFRIPNSIKHLHSKNTFIIHYQSNIVHSIIIIIIFTFLSHTIYRFSDRYKQTETVRRKVYSDQRNGRHFVKFLSLYRKALIYSKESVVRETNMCTKENWTVRYVRLCYVVCSTSTAVWWEWCSHLSVLFVEILLPGVAMRNRLYDHCIGKQTLVNIAKWNVWTVMTGVLLKRTVFGLINDFGTLLRRCKKMIELCSIIIYFAEMWIYYSFDIIKTL